MPTITEENLLNTIDLIYEGACDLSGDGWREAYSTVSTLLSSGPGSIHLIDRSNDHFYAITDRHEKGFFERVNSTYLPLIPYREQLKAMPVAGLFNRKRDCPDDTYIPSELYQEHFKHLGLYQCLNLKLRDDKDFSIGIGFSRPATMLDFSDDDFRAIRILTPHLRRAMDTYLQLHGKDSDRIELLDITNAVGEGVILVGKDGRFRPLNSAVQSLAIRNGNFRIGRSGKLEIGDKTALRKLRALVNTIVGGSNDLRPRGGSINLLAVDGGRELNIKVMPVSPRSVIPGLTSRKALVIIKEADRRAGPEVQLESLYLLTPAEARLADLLADGLDLKECSETLNISVHTARTHLKRIFDKTDTHRQSSLVRLILGSRNAY